MLWIILDFCPLFNTSLLIRLGPNILSIYPLTAISISPREIEVRLCFCRSGSRVLKYSMYSVLKNSFMVLKQVLRKKKSNYLAYFITLCYLTMLTSVSTSTEFSDDDFVTEDMTFSETGDGILHSFSSNFKSLFLLLNFSHVDSSVLASESGSLNNLSISAILSSFFYFTKLMGNRTLKFVLRSHLSAVIKGSKNFMFQRPLSSSFAVPPDNGAHSSGF